MKKIQMNMLLSRFDNTFEELSALESIIKLTQEACLDKEVDSIHYDLQNEKKSNLSEERNHYINMLTIALDKVAKLKKINISIEKELVKL